uniref:Uncharacterized protein n=1 Tax=Arundo donax TaxID=35708 RepID=A0A0A8Y8T4_ARUDO
MTNQTRSYWSPCQSSYGYAVVVRGA